MRLFNQDSMNLSVYSEVKWGIRKLEVALALDNTGSMAQSSKMTNLNSAAHSLLTTLKNAAKNPGDIKVAIIPFTTTVNLGSSYKDNDWFDINSLDCNGSQSGGGCTRARTGRIIGKVVCATAPIRTTPRTTRPALSCRPLCSRSMPAAHSPH